VAEVTPIFIISLPRSGSTLLQRMLSCHPAIATTSETWLLLPLIYSFRERGMITEYKHSFFRRAHAGVLRSLSDRLGPNAAYAVEREAIRSYAETYYAALTPSPCRFFVDKAPPYSLICREIIQMFPNARFIFLWRNPAAVVASIMNAWAGGKFNLFRMRSELYSGLESMLETYRENSDKIHSVAYEELCAAPTATLGKALDYIGCGPAKLKDLHEISLAPGAMGDNSAMRNSPLVSNEMHAKWVDTFRNPIRRLWLVRYIKWIGTNRLALMGYDQASILSTINRQPIGFQHLFSDSWRLSYGYLNNLFELELFSRKMLDLKSRRMLFPHL
jgi:sulfotransferase family protein